MSKLGKIEIVDIREIFRDEARDFTPWLASLEGLTELGEKLGVDLELVSVESRSGSYKADIVAKVINEDEEDHIVVIENQLDSTNHDHLGKIITYSAGHNAKICVWVSTSFTDEHRQAVDWLNEHVTDIAFFAFEIETFRIGDSDPAITFKQISSPNQWARAVRASRNREVSEVKLDQLSFWQDLRAYAESQADGKIHLGRTPRAQHWYHIAIGRSGFLIGLTVNSISKQVGCELYMSDENAKRYFDHLLDQKEEIETELGYPLEWQRLEDKKATRIVVYRSGSIEREEERQELIKWLYEKAKEFHRVFYHLIQSL
jgi:hypothetical protein